jgi:Ca-activated chloride channel family protein
VKRITLVVVILVVALVSALAVRSTVSEDENPLVIVHWSNSHPMRAGLLPDMAAKFNAEKHKTASGRPIKVELVACDSAVQTTDLVSRVKGAGQSEDECKDDSGASAPDPVVVTPQSSDWLVDVNHRAHAGVVDLSTTEDIADTWLGIVTYRAMAECLGWPDKKLGYSDLLKLTTSREGWAAYPDCAKSEWGRSPLLAFTNPNTSTSGRNVLVSLYAMAAQKSPQELTVSDVERPDVQQFVRSFQRSVDHYMPGTIPLNTKVAQGPRYGQFFLMPEDNLVSLHKGTEKAFAVDGTEQRVPPVKDLVMIYPKEGSVLNANPAGIVHASWVTDEEAKAAATWVDYLRDDAQQRAFANAGFRPARGTKGAVDARQFARWGLDARQPHAIDPGLLAPDVLARIVDSWPAVKNPAIVTFVIDVSGSMLGEPLEQVKAGMHQVLDALSSKSAGQNQVGLLTFSDHVLTEIRPAPLKTARYDVSDAVEAMQATGETALYDAVERAVQITDEASGDRNATRAVVVLSDGVANQGTIGLTDIVDVNSKQERPVPSFSGKRDARALDDQKEPVPWSDLVGVRLHVAHQHPVQIFFLGFGDADFDIGRVLAQATGAEYQGSTQDDLAAVIAELNGYF